MFGLLNDHIRSSLCCNLVGENAHLGTFFTINVFFISVLTPANICISTYNKYDIIFYTGLLPDMDDLKIIESGGFGISKVHEIFVLKEDNQILYWKKVN